MEQLPIRIFNGMVPALPLKGQVLTKLQTQVIAAAMAVNMFNGLNTAAWTGWVWFAVLVGIVLIWAYTAIYPVISPGWFVTASYGDEVYLFPSAFFWFGIILTTALALLPRYVAKYYKFTYLPDDIDILRVLRKTDPKHDIAGDPAITGRLKHLVDDDDSSMLTRPSEDGLPTPRRSFQSNRGPPRPGDHRNVSQTDMSTGMRAASSRGFDFSQEEGGYAIRRVQTHLSERHQSRVSLPASLQPKQQRRKSITLNLFPAALRGKRREDKKPPPSPPNPPEQS